MPSTSSSFIRVCFLPEIRNAPWQVVTPSEREVLWSLRDKIDAGMDGLKNAIRPHHSRKYASRR
jgi:hypothetical protein